MITVTLKPGLGHTPKVTLMKQKTPQHVAEFFVSN